MGFISKIGDLGRKAGQSAAQLGARAAEKARELTGQTRRAVQRVSRPFYLEEDDFVSINPLAGEIVQARSALRVQFAVIGALIQREIRTRFGKHRLGYLWAFLDPMLQIAVWVVIFTVIRHMPVTHDMSTLLFLATGILPFFLFRNIAQFVGNAITSNRALLQFPIVSQVDTLIARFLLETVTMVIVSLIIFILLGATGRAYFPRDIFGLLLTSAGILLLAFGFGSFNCMLCVLWPTYEHLIKLLYRILYFTSGIFFTLDHVPIAAQRLLEWNPILYGVEKFREYWSYSYTSPLPSLWYLFSCGTIFLFIALLLNHTVRRRLEGE